jgi:cytidylate kinase
MHAHVAIDGPVAGGKTTVAKILARQLGYLYLDTGAMYRAVALLALRNGVELDSEQAVLDTARANAIRVGLDSGERGYRVFAGEEELGAGLWAREIASVVSVVAAHPLVREELTRRQREIAQIGPVVMAGRDIGTVVLPDAPVKIFLTASIEARVHRRFEEYSQNGERALDLAQLRAQIAERDRIDCSRAVAPLRIAEGATVIDSSALSPEQVVAQIAECVALVKASP